MVPERALAAHGGAEWLERLPRLVEECAEQWSLRLGDPLPGASLSLVLSARLEGGGDAILKVGFPHRESEREAEALSCWNGEGAVRVLAHDPERAALLLERCHPGTQLRELGADVATGVVAGLLPRLWIPAAGPFRPLADEAAWWASYLPDTWERAGRPFERALLDAALAALGELAPTQGEQVLLQP